MNQRIQIIIAAFTIIAAMVASSLATGTEPFLELKLSLPRAIQTIERIAPPEAEKDEAFQAKMATARDSGIASIYLFLYPDEEHGSLPLVMASSPSPDALKELVAPDGLLGPHLEKSTASSYKVKPPPPSEDGEEPTDLPIEDYRLWVSSKLILFAPVSIVNSWKQGAPKPMASRVAKAIAGLPSKQHVISCAVCLPEDVGEKDWDEVATELPIPEGEQSDVLATVGADMLVEMSEALSTIESFAFGFDLAGEDNVRVIEYAQQFRDTADVATLFKQIIQGSGETDEPTDFVSLLCSVLQSESVSMTPALDGNNLSLKLAWSKAADEAVVQAVGGYVMGKVMAAAFSGMDMAMGVSPDDGPIETSYTTEPRIQAGLTSDALKTQLTAEIPAKLFCGHYFSHGDKPHMSVDLDPLDVPNVDLTEITYQVSSVTAPDGTSVMRPDDRDIEKWGPREIHLGHRSGGQIQIPVQKDTPAEKLHEGVVRIDVTLPTDVAVFEFTKEEAGAKKQDGNTSATLREIEKNSVSISYSGEDAEILAYDATGGCLSFSSGMGSGSSKSRNFHGLVERVKVVVAKDMTTFGLDFTCDLNGGEKDELPDEPSDDVRVRYDVSRRQTYANYAEADLDGLQVELEEAGEDGWQDKLFVKLPHEPFSGSGSWEVHFLGPDGDVALKGSSQWSGDEVSYTMEKGSLASVRAVTGALKINVNTDIQTLTFTRTADGEEQEQTLPSGRKASASFDKNSVTFKKGDCKALQSRAYAENGQVLKANWRSHGGAKTFWGIPVRYEVDIADDVITKKIPFTITRQPVEPPTLNAFKERAAQLSSAARELKALQTMGSRTSSSEYDDTVAGFYYLYDRKGNPLAEKRISEALAHSDPAGADRYGYEVKPLRGYHFMRLKGTITRDGKKQENRFSSRERTYKWSGGEFQFKPFSNAAGFVAVPANAAMPTICTSWNDVYIRYCNGVKVEYLEQSLHDTEWRQFHVVD